MQKTIGNNPSRWSILFFTTKDTVKTSDLKNDPKYYLLYRIDKDKNKHLSKLATQLEYNGEKFWGLYLTTVFSDSNIDQARKQYF